MKTSLFTFAAVYSIFALSAQARGGTGVGGGGNDIALEFLQDLSNAVTQIQSAGSTLSHELNGPIVLKTAQSATVVVVDTPLVVNIRGLDQPCVATNNPSTGLIQINRTQWNSILDPRIKEGIALHEVLSLQRLENTGRYPLSSQYVSQFGLPDSVLVTFPVGSLIYLSSEIDFSPGLQSKYLQGGAVVFSPLLTQRFTEIFVNDRSFDVGSMSPHYLTVSSIGPSTTQNEWCLKTDGDPAVSLICAYNPRGISDLHDIQAALQEADMSLVMPGQSLPSFKTLSVEKNR